MKSEEMTIHEARKEAAIVLQAGQKLAQRAKAGTLTPKQRGRLCTEALGGVLNKPSEFWAAACAIESGESTGVDAVALANRYACARMAAGDMAFVRESLIGQAQWCSVLAVKLAGQAEGEGRVERGSILYKLSMQAQRQAAQALATAAALNKLIEADTVTVGG